MYTPLAAQEAVGILQITVFVISVTLATIAFRAYIDDDALRQIKDSHPEEYSSITLEKTLIFFCMASIVVLSTIFVITL